MGVFFNDPDVDFDDIYWYTNLAGSISLAMEENSGLIVFDQELNTHSCYVELHRKGFITECVIQIQ